MTYPMQPKPYYIVPFCQEKVEILLADEDFLVVSKPSGLLSVPGKAPENKDCLITRVQQEYPTATTVHRLDLDTSGVMVVALTKDAHRNISKQFEERRVAKEYVAHVYGIVEQDQGTVDLPLICDWPNRPKQKVDFELGKQAVTHWSVMERCLGNSTNETSTSAYTVVKLKPITGRSHQLRVHMAAIQHPILGCDMYAHADAFRAAPRLMLHAERLTFYHPTTNETIDIIQSPTM